MAHDVGGGTVPLFKCVRVHAQGDGRIRVTKSPSDCAYIDASPDELKGRQQSGHVGLSLLQERVAEAGATLSIDSVPGQGTSIHMRVMRT